MGSKNSKETFLNTLHSLKLKKKNYYTVCYIKLLSSIWLIHFSHNINEGNFFILDEIHFITKFID